MNRRLGLAPTINVGSQGRWAKAQPTINTEDRSQGMEDRIQKIEVNNYEQ